MGESLRVRTLRSEDLGALLDFSFALDGVVSLKDMPPEDGTLAMVPDAPKSPPSPDSIDRARDIVARADSFLIRTLLLV